MDITIKFAHDCKPCPDGCEEPWCEEHQMHYADCPCIGPSQIIDGTDYEQAKELGFTDIPRWENGVDHHPMSERLMAFLKEHDFNDYDDYFYFKTGGDGDNGETLMYEMDAFFELLDVTGVTK